MKECFGNFDLESLDCLSLCNIAIKKNCMKHCGSVTLRHDDRLFKDFDTTRLVSLLDKTVANGKTIELSRVVSFVLTKVNTSEPIAKIWTENYLKKNNYEYISSKQ